MYGVTMPDVSAGSNQVGASEMCKPQVSCPAGAADGRGEQRQCLSARQIAVAERIFAQLGDG